MIYHVTVGGRSFEIEIDGTTVRLDGTEHDVEMGRVGPGPVHALRVDGASHRVAARRLERGRWTVALGAHALVAEVVDERTRAIREMTGATAGALGPRPVRAPMPGMVVRVEVQEGDTVSAGQGVVIVEAMKMENELVAEGAGIVERIHVSQGEAVEKGQLLVDLAPLPGEDA